MKHKLIVLLSFLITTQLLFAQQSKTLTLKEAIELSLQNSNQLKLSAAKIEETTSQIKEAEDKKLPDASISGSYLYLPIKPNVNLKTNSSGGGPNVSQVIYGTANVSVPLYTANKIKYGIESAKILQQALTLDAATDKSAVILNTTTACINLFKAKEAISLVNENLAQATQRVKDLSNLEKNGIIPRNDLLKAELQKSNIELSLLDAESNYKIACVNMNLLIGWPEQTEIMPDRTGLALPTFIKTIEEYEQDATTNRNEIEALNMRKKMALIGVKATKADAYPTIALTGGYVAADIPNFFSVVNAVNIGIGVKYNLASLWKSKTKIEIANSKVKQLEINQQVVNDNIHLQINQAYQNFIVSRKKVQVIENAVIQATENYRITKNKYDNNLSTTTELLEADVALLQSKLGVTNAKADSFLAYQKLLYASGLLKN